MTCITRCVLRWGLIGGVALGVATVIWPGHVKAGLAQASTTAQSIFNRAVSDPVILRQQLASLSEQYPSRIAEVRGELAKVDHQLSQYDRDIEIAQRVVSMTTDDLGRLKALVTRAESEAESTARPVSLRFDGVRFNIDQAYTEARRINNVRTTYRDRLAHDQQQMTFLNEQRTRLANILEQLEAEHNTFQAQLWQLDRQIDAIERNDRLIELTEAQQATLDSYERFGQVGNLKQLEGKLAQLRAVQEAQLQSLEKRGMHRDYEGKARYEMESRDLDGTLDNPFGDLEPIDLREKDNRADRTSRSLAWAEPIVIE
jgi:chromosome segregation ATPase